MKNLGARITLRRCAAAPSVRKRRPYFDARTTTDARVITIFLVLTVANRRESLSNFASLQSLP
ncbi:hypothetical protein [Ensifer adhaerens]|uniref:hypothetical protein n=1 Tax=Ensifer adhaerens TaxID=106592 RepID=UPI001319CBA8|nr:hypothetical protein [Ensifer adhaerens]